MEFLKSLLIIAGIAVGFKGIVKITFEEPCSPAGAGSPLRSDKLQGIFDRKDF